MAYRNTKNGFGLVARLLHWGMAMGIFGLFALGYWMRTLTYYSPYYKTAPELHQGIGLTLFALLVCRFIWKLANPAPIHAKLTALERNGSNLLHWGFYALLLAVMIAGYFISTLDGRVIHYFGLFDIPSAYTHKGLEKLAGKLHRILAYLTIALAVLHAAAAFWHHFVKRDRVLISMIKGPEK